MKRLWPAALLVALLFAFVAAACGSDDGGEGAVPQGARATPASATDEEGQDDKDDVLSSLQDAARDSGQTTYRVVYELDGSDPASGGFSGTLTLAAKPPKQLFMLAGESDGEESTIMLIDAGESSYLCTDAEGNQTCIKSASGGAGAGQMPTVLEVDDLIAGLAADADASAKEVQGQTIAGQDARCFEIKIQEGEGTVCISKKDAALLLLDGTFGGAVVSLRATEVSDSPSDSDFEPPFPVVGE